MTIQEKIQQARVVGYTIKFISESTGINLNTLYAYTSNNYVLSETSEQILSNFLDTLDLDPTHNYSVYMHKNKINNKVYIGLTSLKPELRWKKGARYKGCIYFYNAIQKYGWDSFEHIIIKDRLSAEEASELEKYLIKEYDSTNEEKGYNLREGGKEKYSLSQETREKMAWAKGKQFSEEHKQNISKALKGRTYSPETIERMRDAHKLLGQFKGGKNPKARKVICIETGQIFETMGEAAASVGLKSYSSIANCCRGKTKTAGKYHWKFYEE